MRDFQDSFETREQSLTSAFSICMTVPLNAGLGVSWYLWQNVRIRTFDAIVVTIKVAMIKLHYVLKLKKNRKWHLLFLILLFLWIFKVSLNSIKLSSIKLSKKPSLYVLLYQLFLKQRFGKFMWEFESETIF